MIVLLRSLCMQNARKSAQKQESSPRTAFGRPKGSGRDKKWWELPNREQISRRGVPVIRCQSTTFTIDRNPGAPPTTPRPLSGFRSVSVSSRRARHNRCTNVRNESVPTELNSPGYCCTRTISYFSGFIWGKKITSRMESLFVRSIVNRSMPMPSPAVGGIPYSNARR
ncbi:MAG: hypothetical protein HW389_136 [Bacteroidetes bacterium]|nr:hypothetical protein [Bacteroidota bacterium]